VAENFAGQQRVSARRLKDQAVCVLKLRVCDYPDPLRQRGIVLLRLTQCLEKSLAYRRVDLICFHDPKRQRGIKVAAFTTIIPR
jgi:hypothetical protein